MSRSQVTASLYTGNCFSSLRWSRQVPPKRRNTVDDNAMQSPQNRKSTRNVAYPVNLGFVSDLSLVFMPFFALIKSMQKVRHFAFLHTSLSVPPNFMAVCVVHVNCFFTSFFHVTLFLHIFKSVSSSSIAHFFQWFAALQLTHSLCVLR
jgi:hypothetical protein